VISVGYSPHWSPDGLRLAFADANNELLISNADGSNVRSVGVGQPGPWHPGVSSAPQPGPTSASSPMTTIDPVDTTAWTPYTSRQYGLSYRHPSDWTVISASREFSPAADTIFDPLSPAMDRFQNPAGNLEVRILSLPGQVELSDGVFDVNDWVQAVCEPNARFELGNCPQGAERAASICLRSPECPPAAITRYAGDTHAYASSSDTDSTIVAIVTGTELSPELEPYGGPRGLLVAFLRTMCNDPNDRTTEPPVYSC
jgi:hypothetical protein